LLDGHLEVQIGTQYFNVAYICIDAELVLKLRCACVVLMAFAGDYGVAHLATNANRCGFH
jgi:hypothetical protein